MKFFAISLGLLVGSALSEAFRSYNVNYGNLNSKDYTRHLLASERYQNMVDYPGYATFSRNPNTVRWGSLQQPQPTYPIYGTQNTVAQLNHYNNPYNGNVGQQQIQTTYPIYGTQDTVGQQQLNNNYNPYGNQQQVQEEWIVPVKIEKLYNYRNQNNQLKTIGYRPQPPVKTTYYTK